MADALAPGIVVAQAIGRWGNWFNQELYGKPTTLPWGLEIDPAHRASLAPQYQKYETFHPTYLYEFGWNLGVAALVIWADRRFRLGHGRAFALYVMGYTAGRGWIEYLRIDAVEANDVFGLRLNVWTSIVVFLLAATYFVVVGRRHPDREESVFRDGHTPAPGSDAGSDTGTTAVPASAPVESAPTTVTRSDPETTEKHPTSGEDPQER